MVVGGQVIHNIVDNGIGRMRFNVLFENPGENVPVMIGSAATKDFPCSWVQKCEQVSDAITSVIEVLKNGLMIGGRQVRRKAFECLDAGALVKTV